VLDGSSTEVADSIQVLDCSSSTEVADSIQALVDSAEVADSNRS